jgi:hypothetical protein
VYRAWNGPIVRSTLPPYDADSRAMLRTLIRTIVATEGPVGMSRIAQTVRRAWPVGSGGARTSEAVEVVVTSMIGSDFIIHEDGFIAVQSQSVDVVRVPDGDNPYTKRRIDEVPWSELLAALSNILRSSGAVQEDELITYTARLFGWARVGAQIESGIREAVRTLVASGEVARSEGFTLAAVDQVPD